MFSSMIVSLTVDPSNDYPSAREMTLKDMGKIGPYITTRKYKHVHNSCYKPHGIARELFKYKMLSHNYISLRSDSLTTLYFYIKIPIPGGLRAGGVLLSWSGPVGGCQTCGTHISVTAWWIFSVQSSVEFSRPVVVHRHGHLPICPIWACPWTKNLSNLAQIGSRLCGTHISDTAGWIDSI